MPPNGESVDISVQGACTRFLWFRTPQTQDLDSYVSTCWCNCNIICTYAVNRGTCSADSVFYNEANKMWCEPIDSIHIHITMYGKLL